ncbi:hypothetical protein [Alginatibacterium sediminis]|uniref:hypothetical protein n=1 Tax=Alginatibacterium sediminis TaxID=2164068 RepID=UPI0018F54283|nr:hypothetical protein [Alginatibacterium sediminis]
MKSIEVDEQLYRYIASQTQDIGESASDILRRLLGFEPLGNRVSPDDALVSNTKALTGEALVNTPDQAIKAASSESGEKKTENLSNTSSSATIKVSAKKTNSSKLKPKASNTKTVKRRKYQLSFNPKQIPSAEDFCNEIKAEQGLSITQRYLAVLAYLHAIDPNSFGQACQLKGSKRLYFAASQEELLTSGNNSKPQAIEGSEFWAVTNNNSQRKRFLTGQLASAMQVDEQSMEQLLDVLA